MNSLQQLQDEIRQCSLCNLCKNNPKGTSPVPGKGPDKTYVMIVGMCPGIDEIYAEEPFIGRSGKLLRKSLIEQDIKPERCYITNVIKCVSRKGNKNVDPSKKDQKTCSTQWLQKEIELIRPKVVMTLGRIPLDATFRFYLDECLGKKNVPLKDIIEKEFRQSPFTVDGIEIIPNYHPSYILRGNKRAFQTFIRQIQLLKEVIK